MTRIDSLVVGGLVVMLAILAGLVGVPTLLPAASTAALPSPSAGSIERRPYVEGVLGRPVSVSPLSARTQADRDLVALVYAGLVKNGPAGAVVPDLAERWTVDGTGAVWTFELRDDAVWHDGEPVTAEDVAFTIRVLQDPDYHGPGAGSWNEVKVRTIGMRSIVFTLATPLGGFLQAATQPIAPFHLLGEVPVEQLEDDPIGRQPIGAGPFAVASLTDDRAELIPAATLLAASTGRRRGPRRARPIRWPRRRRPAVRRGRCRTSPGWSSASSTTPRHWPRRTATGDLDAASGLVAGDGTRARIGQGQPRAALPGLDPDRGPAQPASRPPRVRQPGRPDRPAGRRSTGAGSSTTPSRWAPAPRPSPIPPTSALFDPAADPAVAYDPEAAKAALLKAGWTSAADGWHLPGVATAISIELLSPDEASNPAAFADCGRGRARLDQARADGQARAAGAGRVRQRPAGHRPVQAAVGDITIGLDPDLYPLFASSQTRTGGSNVIGLQDQALDKLLAAARGPGTRRGPDGRLRGPRGSSWQRAGTCSRWPSRTSRSWSATRSKDRSSGRSRDPADRFWDVLTWRLAAGR